MKSKNLPIILFTLVVISSMSFESAEQQILPTKLSVTVIDGTGNFVEGATVTLFATEDDYINSKNALQTAVSGKKGKTVFKKLEPITYYLDVRKGDQSNDGRGSQTGQLREGRVNKVNVVIE